MKVEKFVKILGADFFTGIPDSQLKEFCNYLISMYGVDGIHHIIAANEGNCTAIAAGYHLATGKIPVVYMQNSGEGNIINPVVSLMNNKVYGIPCIFIIGWRGEPGIHDEPQHVYQGEITLKLLDNIGIASYVVGKDTTEDNIVSKMTEFKIQLDQGKQVAFIIRKGAFTFDKEIKYSNNYTMLREDVIKYITAVSEEDVIISTTGKTSRELFEIREANAQPHSYDFLTIGSMGHCSSIALGIAFQMPEKKIWIIDGDGSVLMHMGSMAVMGASAPKNIVHIVINNGAHESVGGLPTVAKNLNFIEVAKGCGYLKAVSVDNFEDLDVALKEAKEKDVLTLIDVKCAIGARDDLGRPTSSAKENKEIFMEYLLSINNKF